MCGYVGEICLTPTVDRRRLYRMNNTLMHRGPDESDIRISADRRWGVGHRRLCVIDIAGGKQPMVDAERQLTLVYNGEVYDYDRLRNELSQRGYHFHTNSDTEVVLALYAIHGLDFFEQLRGEFAFGIIDERKREAILVRDRMGLKPLFYTRVGNRFLFASEIKSLFADDEVPRKFDPIGMTGAIAVVDTPGNTVFQGIRQVRNAHFVKVNLDTLETSEHCYWDALADRRKDIPASFPDQVALVREEVDRAIALRLRADVPVGAYLSGGLDSSLVAARMAQSVDSLDAFGLSFTDSPAHDEFHYAEMVAKRYPNIRLHRIPVSYNDMVRRLPETTWHLERPFGNLHSVAKIMAAQYARDYVVCVLTGDGGDESFCGYSSFWLQQVLQEANYSLPAIQVRLKAMTKEASGIGGNRYYLTGGLARKSGKSMKFLVDALGFAPTDLARGADSEKQLHLLMNPDFRKKLSPSPTERLASQLSASMPSADSLPHMTLLQYVHFNAIVPEYIATIADRSEFAGSVEARPPLFDHKVVEMAMSLPPASKMKGDREKHVLREAYKDVVPVEVIERRKQAFLAPPAPFSCIDGRSLLERYLNPKAVREAGVWDANRVMILRGLRRMAPRNRFVNLALTVALTVQILHEQFIERKGI